MNVDMDGYRTGKLSRKYVNINIVMSSLFEITKSHVWEFSEMFE